METGRCIQEAVSCSASCANCGIRPSSPVTRLTGLLDLFTDTLAGLTVCS